MAALINVRKKLNSLVSLISFNISVFPLGLLGCVISAGWGGLGNRLKSLVSSMRLADELSTSLLLYWPSNPGCNCKFPDLFENKIVEIDEKTLKGISERLKTYIFGEIPTDVMKYKNRIFKKYIIVIAWKLLLLPEEKPLNSLSQTPPLEDGDIDQQYEGIPPHIKEKVLIYINRITPKKFIIEKVNDFSKNFDDDTISVGIRTWRTYIEYDDKDKKRSYFFDVNRVYKVMDKMADRKFFVSCDSQEVLNKIIQRYGKSVFYYPPRTFPGDRGSKEGIQDALVELLLLSKNKTLLATHESTFSEMAWWFGGCKAKVEII